MTLPPPTATTTSASPQRRTPRSTVATSGTPDTLQRYKPSNMFLMGRASKDLAPVTTKMRDPKRRATSSVFRLSSRPKRISGGVRKVNATSGVRVRVDGRVLGGGARDVLERLDLLDPARVVRGLPVGLHRGLVLIDLVEGA